MPFQTPSASDYTNTVKGAAEASATVAGAVSGIFRKPSGSAVIPTAGALRGAVALVTQSRVAQTSRLQPVSVRSTATAPVVLPAWAPTQLGKPLYIWLDAADPLNTGAEPTNDTQITTWSDKSGNSRNAIAKLQTNITVYPKYKAKALNGGTKPAIETLSDGNYVPHVWFDITTLENQFSTNLVWFVVYEGHRQTDSTYNAIITRAMTGSSRFFDQYGNSRIITGFGYTSVWNGGSGWNHSKSGSDTPAGPRNNPSILVQSVTSTGNNTNALVEEFVNGSFVWNSTGGVANVSDAGQTKITIGSRGDGGTSSELYISEIIVFNVAITTSERQKIEGYLAWKWGLESKLPANHPYKSARPT